MTSSTRRRASNSSSNKKSSMRMATVAAAAATAAAAAAAAAVLLRAPLAAAAAAPAARSHSTTAAFLLPLPSSSFFRHSPHPQPQNQPQHQRLGGGVRPLVRPLSAAGKGANGRPSLDDVERISKGQAAKKRGVGSRAVCHRLNEMERKEFDLAKKLGFVQLRGTGYRRERKGSPLANIHRQLCDALARPCVEIHRGLGADAVDEVVVDVSPLRPTEPGGLDAAFAVLRALEAEVMPEGKPEGEKEGEGEGEEVRASFPAEDWETRAIWCV